MVDHFEEKPNNDYDTEEEDSNGNYFTISENGNEENPEHLTLDTFTITPLDLSADEGLRDTNYSNFEPDNDDKDDSAFEAVSMKFDAGIRNETRKWFQWIRCTQRKDGNAEGSDQPSNESLLSVAFVSFMAFTVLQSFAAYIAGSEAMMGDSAAMAVDAFTYGFNLIAERMKNNSSKEKITNDQTDKDSSLTDSNTSIDDEFGIEEMTPTQIQRIEIRSTRKKRLYLELIPPMISVLTLIIVTSFVLKNAIYTIVLDESRPTSEQDTPNLILMFGFSTLNLFIDFFNVFCFAKAKHGFGYKTVDHDYISENEQELEEILKLSSPNILSHQNGKKLNSKDLSDIRKMTHKPQDGSTYAYVSHEESSSFEDNFELVDYGKTYERKKPTYEYSFDPTNENNQPSPQEEEANLNMCSAYTHVFADTIRSIAVVVAALVAELYENVTPEEADTTAAVVVSAVILISLIPLLKGLINNISELMIIRKEERAEKMSREILSKTNTPFQVEIT